jgi:hypothetical protein
MTVPTGALERCVHGTHPDATCAECTLGLWERSPRPPRDRDALGDRYRELDALPDDPRVAELESAGLWADAPGLRVVT